MEFATIGSALTSRRKFLNIDQARAAAIVGMSRTTFSSYERDLQRPSAEVLPGLARFLEISIDDVLTLYGGTCIASLRPSLEKILATQGPEGRSSAANVQPPSIDAPPDSGTPEPETASDLETIPPALREPVTLATDLTTPTPRDASVSIFAHELSDDIPRGAALAAHSSDLGQDATKIAKGDGKKKKRKKGKKAKT
jgi:transcriptional regulator with XRE-family HTH domain